MPPRDAAGAAGKPPLAVYSGLLCTSSMEPPASRSASSRSSAACFITVGSARSSAFGGFRGPSTGNIGLLADTGGSSGKSLARSSGSVDA